MNNIENPADDTDKTWFKAAPIDKFPKNSGACVKYGERQVAVFNFTRENKWYACQNLCPHKREMVLSRGLIGVEEGEPKVACPLHKNTFSLKTGASLSGACDAIITYPVKIADGFVWIGFSD